MRFGILRSRSKFQALGRFGEVLLHFLNGKQKHLVGRVCATVGVCWHLGALGAVVLRGLQNFALLRFAKRRVEKVCV